VSNHVPDHPVRRPSGWSALALGGGGLGGLLIHLIIFRLIRRSAVEIWRIHTFGPIIDIVLGVVLVALIILRAHRGRGWWRRRGGRPGFGSRSGSGSGPGDDTSGWSRGPRDW
jgi:hypothetical protein